ncbi:MAG: substrate-binding domain-containing protein [Desulfuromonadaceae bacterium]
MKKQIKVSLTISAALLAMSGIAQAAPAELNIYGASAQYLYWNANAKAFAESLGCTATAPVNNGGKHGFVSATNCTSTLVPQNAANANKRDLDIRYSGIASAEGPLSVNRKAPLDATLATGCDIAAGGRLMYASASSTICKPVHVGTSDVAGESLIQTSTGAKFGPSPTDRSNPVKNNGPFSVTLPAKGISTAGLTAANTVVVPFGFFVNNGVTARACTAGLIGSYCTTDHECDSIFPGTLADGVTLLPGNGVCNPAATPITNVSREQVGIIFSGYAANWKDLGDYFSDVPVVACLRHAGSGTHSAFDLTVMNGGWGMNTATAEAAGQIYFNQGSTDQVRCVNGSTATTPNGSLNGAIGYADADQSVGVSTSFDNQNVHAVAYNGVFPTRAAIRNGLYDFYTDAWIYTNPLNTATVNALASSLITFAQDPANIPVSKKNYWATTAEMKFNRSADNGYPVSTPDPTTCGATGDQACYQLP